MLIFYERHLVFLATPKTASTAIGVALESLACLSVQRPPALKHADISTYHKYIAPWLQQTNSDPFTTIAMMREPVDWLRSWYRFHLRDRHQDMDDDPSAPSFEDFVTRYLADPASLTMGLGTQSNFLVKDGHKVQRIFRYEAMEDFTDFLDEHLDCHISLPRLNVPPSVDVSLSPALMNDLEKALEKDIALYQSLI